MNRKQWTQIHLSFLNFSVTIHGCITTNIHLLVINLQAYSTQFGISQALKNYLNKAVCKITNHSRCSYLKINKISSLLMPNCKILRHSFFTVLKIMYLRKSLRRLHSYKNIRGYQSSLSFLHLAKQTYKVAWKAKIHWSRVNGYKVRHSKRSCGITLSIKHVWGTNSKWQSAGKKNRLYYLYSNIHKAQVFFGNF